MSAIGFQAGFRSGMRNATATRSLVGAIFTLSIVAVISLAEKQASVFGAASRALEDRVFGLLLPFVLLYVSTRILQPVRLEDAAAPIARFGFSRRSVGLGLVVASMVAGGALAAVAAAETALLAHDLTAPPPALDAFNCAWIGALTGFAYAGLFALGATFGARGGGRFWALGLDFVLGATSGFAAVLVPRAHAQNLLGGEPPLLLAQPASAALLVLLAIVFTALALGRSTP
jgi:hypothetical protein